MLRVFIKVVTEGEPQFIAEHGLYVSFSVFSFEKDSIFDI